MGKRVRCETGSGIGKRFSVWSRTVRTVFDNSTADPGLSVSELRLRSISDGLGLAEDFDDVLLVVSTVYQNAQHEGGRP